jgi:hypothetical protein
VRLTDIAQAVAQHGAEKYVEKKGFALPLGIGVGLSLPDTYHHAEDSYRDTRRKLDAASLQTLYPGATKNAFAMPSWLSSMGSSLGSAGKAVGESASSGALGGVGAGVGAMTALPLAGVAGGLSNVIGKGLERALVPREFGEKKDVTHQFGNAAVGAFGKELGTMGAGLLRDIANKAMSVAGNIGNESARTAILQQLRREDSVIHDADDKTLMEAYHTMTRFAPVLSTDKNAVRSFLRQAVMSGNGPDYMTIKLLADSERAVTGDKE